MPTPNVALLQQTLDQIKTDPKNWEQAIYRAVTPCGTAMCFAGWSAGLDGGQWIGDTSYLVPEPEDYVMDVIANTVHVHERATRILGLTDTEAEDLFNPNNNLRYIEQAVAELCAKAEAQAARDGAPLPGHEEMCGGDSMCVDCAAYDKECHEVDHVEPKPVGR